MFKNKQEKEHILKSTQNEVLQTLTDSIFYISGYDKEMAIKEAFNYWTVNDQINYIAYFMLSTHEPKYVELAYILKDILEAERFKNKEIMFQEANLVTKREFEYGFRNINSTYREFMQIRKRCYKASEKIFSRLKRYKGVINFYDTGDYIKLYNDLIKEFGVDGDIKLHNNMQTAVEYLDSHETLLFMNCDKNIKGL